MNRRRWTKAIYVSAAADTGVLIGASNELNIIWGWTAASVRYYDGRYRHFITSTTECHPVIWLDLRDVFPLLFSYTRCVRLWPIVPLCSDDSCFHELSETSVTSLSSEIYVTRIQDLLLKSKTSIRIQESSYGYFDPDRKYFIQTRQ